jgi:hypothetical protein
MNLQGHIRRVLREHLINEGYIGIPNSELNKIGILLDLIKADIQKYQRNKLPYSSAYVDFKNFFKFINDDGDYEYVSVGIYNDDSDVGQARMDVYNNILLINVKDWNNLDYITLNYFENIITHELVHSRDKLLKKIDTFSPYYNKKGAEPTGNMFNLSKTTGSKSEFTKNYEKYRKSQHEYNADLTPLINNIKKIVGKNEFKLKIIFWIISNINNFDNSRELFHKTKEYFDVENKTIFNSTDEYWVFVNNLFNIIKPWTTKPSLYKKFINDLYTALDK